MRRDTRRSFWNVSAQEARAHALILAVAVWIVGAIRWMTGPFVGSGDFCFFYTCGWLARTGNVDRLYNSGAFHATQVALFPSSADTWFPTVYPPQAALLMAPISALPYQWAMYLWALGSLALTAIILAGAYRVVRHQLPDVTLAILAAAAFQPLCELIVSGQISVVVLGACYLGWLALERDRRMLAGAALGLLAIKPQFGLPFAVIVLATRNWRMLTGALLCVLAQVIAVWVTMGAEALTGFVNMVPAILGDIDGLEVATQRSHSIRALTRLTPVWLGLPLWVVTCGLVLWQVVRVWRSDAPLPVRFGLAMLAAVLCNPHLIVYDAVLLMLPLLWFASWLESGAYHGLLYGLFLMFFVPVGAFARVQPTVLLMLAIVWLVTRQATRPVEADLQVGLS
jgi:hypothetical protein